MVTPANLDEYTRKFKPFCARTESRYNITEPWVAGGYLVATDGRVCIRVRCEGVPESPLVNGQKFPPTNELKWDEGWNDTPIVFGDIPEPPLVDCEKCFGGDCTCDCGHEHACKTCGGTGAVHLHRSIDLGAILLNARFLHNAAAIGCTSLRVKKDKPGTKPALLESPDGCQILIMPITFDTAEKSEEQRTPDEYRAECAKK